MACSDLSGLTGTETPDAAANDASGEDGASPADANAADDASDAGATDGAIDADAQVRCADASGIGPPLIATATFCIDSTEVSQADYGSFLIAKTGDTSGQPTACGWNVS